jgi:hypothetical protein
MSVGGTPEEGDRAEGPDRAHHGDGEGQHDPAPRPEHQVEEDGEHGDARGDQEPQVAEHPAVDGVLHVGAAGQVEAHARRGLGVENSADPRVEPGVDELAVRELLERHVDGGGAPVR